MQVDSKDATTPQIPPQNYVGKLSTEPVLVINSFLDPKSLVAFIATCRSYRGHAAEPFIARETKANRLYLLKKLSCTLRLNPKQDCLQKAEAIVSDRKSRNLDPSSYERLPAAFTEESEMKSLLQKMQALYWIHFSTINAKSLLTYMKPPYWNWRGQFEKACGSLKVVEFAGNFFAKHKVTIEEMLKQQSWKEKENSQTAVTRVSRSSNSEKLSAIEAYFSSPQCYERLTRLPTFAVVTSFPEAPPEALDKIQEIFLQDTESMRELATLVSQALSNTVTGDELTAVQKIESDPHFQQMLKAMDIWNFLIIQQNSRHTQKCLKLFDATRLS